MRKMEIQFILFLILLIVFISIFIHLQLKKETRTIEIIDKNGKSVFVEVELANNMTKRMKGLMFRESLGENEGMLFVFDKETYHTFWMMNTTIPLDAIHISANGSVVDIIQMDPCKSLVFCKRYTPKAKGKYVLEVNQGFAEKNGIEIGNSRLMIKE